MPNVIKIKSSATGGVVPGSLAVGELAINRADGLLYYTNSSGAIVSLTTKSGVNAKIDSLAFSGASTFALTSGGVAVTPASASSLLVSMNGVIQEPLVDFTVSGSNITFTDTPVFADQFFGLHMTGSANTVNAVTSTPSTIAANQNNYSLPSGADIVRVSSSATYTITGIVAVTGGVIMLTNVGSFDVRLSHNSSSSTAANRVTTATGLDVVIAPNDSLTIVYDAVSARWRTAGVVKSYTVGVATAYDFTRSSAPAAATGSAGSWTFAIPTTATHITILCHGAGSGGASGRKGALASGRSGGGGGAPGGWGEFSYKITDLSTNTVVVSVGAGGAGGAAVTADSTNGNAGSSGGGGQVTCGGNTIANGYGTSGGAAGTATTAAAGGAIWTSQWGPNVSGNIGNSTVAGGTGLYNNHTSGSGGGGGGASAADVAYAGGAGGTMPVTLGAYGAPVAGTSGGGAGVAGATYFTRWGTGGSGGGGNASATGNGGAGGNAGTGGGGGGGGGSTNSGNTTYYSGVGGNGGDGFVRIIVWS